MDNIVNKWASSVTPYDVTGEQQVNPTPSENDM